MRATQLIETQRAAASSATATTAAAGWQALTGTEQGSASALGALTDTDGVITGTITSGGAVEPEAGSWRSSLLRTADGRKVAGTCGLLLRAAGLPSTDVVYWVGIADGPDLATAGNWALFGVDSDGRALVRRKTSSQAAATTTATGLLTAARGVQGSVAWERHTSGDPRVTLSQAKPFDDLGRLGETSGQTVSVNPQWYYDYEQDLYQVVAVSTEGAVTAEAVSITALLAVAAPPRNAGTANGEAVWAIVLGQSNVISTPGTDATTISVTREPGDAVAISGVSSPEYPASGQHGIEVGMVSEHTGSIRRGVVVEGSGGITAADIRDTYLPQAITVARQAGITEATLFFYQGGGDAGTLAEGQAHQATVETIIANFRAAFPDARVVLNYLQNDAADHAAGRDAINAGFDTIAAADPLVETWGGTYAKSDDRHETTAALEQHGQDWAALMVGYGLWDGVPV